MNTMESGVLASKLVLKSIFRVKNSCHTHLSIENSQNAVSRAKIVIQGAFRISHIDSTASSKSASMSVLHSYSLHADSGAKILIQVRPCGLHS